MSSAPPDYVTHYYVAGQRPFLNVSELTDPEWEVVRQGLEAERLAGRSSRVFGRRYLELRRATEAKLRDQFIAAGGGPERTSPHYFVLGSSAWFRGLAHEMHEVVIPLAMLPDAATSMTIPDSMTSMGLGGDFGLPVENRPHHGRVFRLSQIREAVEEFGLPEGEPGNYAGYQHRSFEVYAEIQVWSDVILNFRVSSTGVLAGSQITGSAGTPRPMTGLPNGIESLPDHAGRSGHQSVTGLLRSPRLVWPVAK